MDARRRISQHYSPLRKSEGFSHRRAGTAGTHRYAQGLGRKLGIELRAICATNVETFASVFIPEDDVDSQYHLMGHGLKLTCPVKRYSTSTVRSSIKWLALCLQHRRGRQCGHLFD